MFCYAGRWSQFPGGIVVGWLAGICDFLTVILSDLIGRLDLNEADKLIDRDPVSLERSNHW